MKFLAYEDVPLFIGTEGSVLSSSSPQGITFSLTISENTDSDGSVYNFSENGETNSTYGTKVYVDSTNAYYISFGEIPDIEAGVNIFGWHLYSDNSNFNEGTDSITLDNGAAQKTYTLYSVNSTVWNAGPQSAFSFNMPSYNGSAVNWDPNSISSFGDIGTEKLISTESEFNSSISGGGSSAGRIGHADFIFASQASLSVSQQTIPKRYVDDNVIRICQFGNGTQGNFPYSSPSFTNGSTHVACFGPSSGPPKPLSTSIYKIPKDTKITFASGKHLYFDHDVFPDGFDYLARLRSSSGTWTLSAGEAQSGYFEPIYDYATIGPAVGKLNVSFYPNTGNLKSFFNITGIAQPNVFPPISEEKITGHLGEYRFSDAYLESFNFSVSRNAIVNASASFDIYGPLTKDTSISSSYYSTGLYQQKSIPHGDNSTIVGTTSLGIHHPVSCSYNIKVDRVPRVSLNQSIPTRVSKKATTISMSVNGEGLDPSLLTDSTLSKRANLSVLLSDLNYQGFSEENSNGFMNMLTCSGIIESQNLSVSSDGYLNGSLSVKQHLR